MWTHKIMETCDLHGPGGAYIGGPKAFYKISCRVHVEQVFASVR